MFKADRSLLVVALGVGLLSATAGAQETTNVIGPPQLRDFQLTPKQRIVTQPNPNTPPVQIAPPPPTQRQPAPAARPQTQTPAPTQRAPDPARTQPAQPTTEVAPQTVQPQAAQPQPQAAQPQPEQPLITPIPVETEPAPPAAAAPAGTNWWLYAIPLILVGLAGAAWLRRRRRSEEDEAEPLELAVAAPAAPPAPRPDPVPRPWLELELKTERASFTDAEAVIVFELSISNSGGSLARNLRIDVKMFNAGREQDKEIGAFFRTAGRESTKLNLPGIAANSTGIIRGEVAMPMEEMRAVQLDGRMLFIPVVAVNALYDWDGGRTGHTARSYVVGRELEQSADKMGAFRVDQGPRIWRTIGQRPHKLAKRV